jgi:hypothetical protein
VRCHGPNIFCEEDMTCLVHRGMLYMTGELGTFKDGNMCNMQRVNRNLYCKLSEDAHDAQRFFVPQRGRLEITSRVNGMIRGN